MLTEQEVSDHLEITRLLQIYFEAMDHKHYERLSQVFAPDARVDYKVGQMHSGMICSNEMIAHLRSFAGGFAFIQHLMSHPLIEVSGDSATSMVNVRSFHVQKTVENGSNPWTVYGDYHDVHTRTDAGWRIQTRVFRSLHVEGKLLPPGQIQLPPVTR